VSVQNREVSHLCQMLLIAAAGAALLATVRPGLLPVAVGPGEGVCVGYGVAVLSFTAFPSFRRSDLCGLAVLSLVAQSLLGLACQHRLNWVMAGAEVAGAGVAYASSFLERFRSAARSAPREAFSLRSRHDRRRSAPRVRSARPMAAPSPVAG
jgi:hypothetical protein